MTSMKNGLKLHYVGDIEIGERAKGLFILQGDRFDQLADDAYDYWERAESLIRKFNARRLKKGGRLAAIVLDGPREAIISSPVIRTMVEGVDQLFCS